jgi:drug/metabolite transporter (DMT)-like permease
MAKLSEHKYYSYFILIFLALIWGNSFYLIKVGLVKFTPVELAALRVFFSALFLLPWAIRRLPEVPKKQYFNVTMLTIIGNFIPAFLFALAETHVTSSLSGILNALSPLFTFLIAVLFFRRKMFATQLIGIIIGFLGSAGLSFTDSSGNLGSLNYYCLFVVFATIFYGMNSNFIKEYFSHYSALTLTSVSFLFNGIIAVVILFALDVPAKIMSAPVEHFEALGAIILLGFFGTALSLVIFNKLILLESAVFASSVAYAIPVVAVVIGFFDGEILTYFHFIGMALIIFGVYMTNKKQN